MGGSVADMTRCKVSDESREVMGEWGLVVSMLARMIVWDENFDLFWVSTDDAHWRYQPLEGLDA